MKTHEEQAAAAEKLNAQPDVFERRYMEQVREHEAKVAAMTNDEVFDWRERMAREVIEKRPCEDCVQFSYHEVVEILRDHPHLTLNQFVEGAKLRLSYAAGYVQACAACAAAPEERRDWIREIPLDAFRKFQAEHYDVYAIDDMKALVAYVTNIMPEKKGFEFL